MEGISAITCTMRPDQIDNIFNNYDRQLLTEKELILILNHDEMDLNQLKWKASFYQNVSVYKLPQNQTLGTCLNFGIRKAKYPFIAKMDDDDYYASKYLIQALRALQNTDASVVGKMSVTTYFEGEDLLAVRRPGHENQYLTHVDFDAPHLGGGTLVWRKNLIRFVNFRNRNIGEDVLFQKECFDKGFKVYSTDVNNYVSIRRCDKETHTWKGEDDVVLKECDIIGCHKDYKLYVEE